MDGRAAESLTRAKYGGLGRRRRRRGQDRLYRRHQSDGILPTTTKPIHWITTATAAAGADHRRRLEIIPRASAAVNWKSGDHGRRLTNQGREFGFGWAIRGGDSYSAAD